MLLEYGDTRSHSFAPSIMQQTVPRIDLNAAVLQELLAAQTREFDEFKQAMLASLQGRANPEAFIAKYSTTITNKQDERALMDLEQGPRESLKDFHERYKAILNNIPSIDNKIAYMTFYRGLKPQGLPRSPQREYRNYSRGRSASSPREAQRNRRDPSPQLAGRIDIISRVVQEGDSRKNYARREYIPSSRLPSYVSNQSPFPMGNYRH
ncbi:hypothetical protein LIER_03936 [Lithospermum erythrorhizon]|uniref:Retrotransposon gag domain-containing protein n=1 Tax=Lithospermum erythrorhizon TaxID=34254 RepID=A0AAV3NVB4_LITER